MFFYVLKSNWAQQGCLSFCLSWEDSKAEGASATRDRNHLEAPSLTCLAPGPGWLQCRALLGLPPSASHVASVWGLGFLTAWRPWDSCISYSLQRECSRWQCRNCIVFMTALASLLCNCPAPRKKKKKNSWRNFKHHPEHPRGDLGMRASAYTVPPSLPWFGLKQAPGRDLLFTLLTRTQRNTCTHRSSAMSVKLWKVCGQPSLGDGGEKAERTLLREGENALLVPMNCSPFPALCSQISDVWQLCVSTVTRSLQRAFPLTFLFRIHRWEFL